MIRCSMCGDKVVGYGHQLIKALVTPPAGCGIESLQPRPRIMHPAAAASFQPLRERMENEWTPQMMSVLGIDRESLPVIWDTDFLSGTRDRINDDTYVLREINVSCVFAIPDDALPKTARLTFEVSDGVAPMALLRFDTFGAGRRRSHRAVAANGELQAPRPLALGAGPDDVLVLREEVDLLRIDTRTRGCANG